MENIIVYTDEGVEVHLNDGSKTLEEYEAKQAQYLGDEWTESSSPESVSA
ncbi:hypothetical protein L1D41_03110 [Vibrio harveyi]|nr:hypothetical protein [Vibrio harveyi]MCG9608669.1 hypothetical protein [Vibrio harveyi]MCG9666674.1 hypothetical protein [Vibrio harveyi]